MRGKQIAAVAGFGVAIVGLLVLGYGILRMSATGNTECVGDECLDDLWFLAFPVGIMAMTAGLIIGSWALGAIRAERGASGPFRVFGTMTGLGAVFLVMGVFFGIGFSQAGQEADSTFLFLGILFGVLGLCFIGIDLLRFRGELKTDRLRVSGLHGTAKVVAVNDSNVTVNNSPMVSFDLDVTVPGQPPFRVRKRTVISRLSVGALLPGAVVQVLADPANPRDVAIDWEGGVTNDGTAAGTSAADAIRAFTSSGAWNAGGTQGLALASGPANAAILRSVSAALEQAAERAEHGELGATQLPNGTTVVHGRTFVTVNGKAIDPQELAAIYGSLPGVIGAAVRHLGPATFTIPDIAPAGALPASAAAASPASTAVPMTSTSPSTEPATPATPTASPPPSPGAPTIGIAAASIPGTTPATGSPPPGPDDLPARVTIDGFQDTGVDIGGNRLYTFDLTVSVAGREPYPLKHAAVVPQAQVARLTYGASFPAHVDPAIPGNITVQWDR